MAERDSGWLHIYVENAQEAYDSIIQAFKIAEDTGISLPIIIGLDGFTISHTLENVDVLSDEVVKQFVGERVLPMVMTHEGKMVPFKLDPDNPMTMGPNVAPAYYFEFKRQQEEAMKNALTKIPEVTAAYAKISGRNYGDGLIDAYKLDDAEFAVIVVGSTAGTLKVIVDELRQEGIKAGILRLRTFRPFPVEQLRNALKNVKAIAVMDKSMTPGGLGGPVFTETRNALFDLKQRPLISSYIFGLGGRDSNPRELRRIFEDLRRVAKTGQLESVIHYLGLKE
jgi:pyruvate ferredoxin oxidoreductase alpha subunit